MKKLSYAKMKRGPEPDPIATRVKVIATRLDLPDETREAMQEIRVAAEVFAQTLETVFKKHKRDTGRAIAAIDTIQHAKNLACDALLLPHATVFLPDQTQQQ
jgi:hypothetical protein